MIWTSSVLHFPNNLMSGVSVTAGAVSQSVMLGGKMWEKMWEKWGKICGENVGKYVRKRGENVGKRGVGNGKKCGEKWEKRG